MSKDSSFIKPFLVDNLSVNGKIIHLEDSVSQIISQHNYPDEISKLLSEILVFVSMLGHNMKSSAIVTCQVSSKNSIIKLLVADYLLDDNGEVFLRGYSEFDQDRFNIALDKSFKNLVKDATMMITIDLAGEHSKRYQGIVDMKGDNLADAVTEYMKSSQQIDAKIQISSKKLSNGNWKAGGMIIQKLPEKDGVEASEDNWDKAVSFVSTLAKEELLLEDITTDILLYRLFHEDEVYLYDETKVMHKCRCSRERMSRSMDTIPENERDSLKIDGVIAIKCQFCGKEEHFE